MRLFNRTPDGYVPTLAGQDVRQTGRTPRSGSHLALERDVTGRDTRLAGRSASPAPRRGHPRPGAELRELHAQHPDIMIELIPNPRELSLCDARGGLSLRMKQPEQHDLVVRRIGSMAFGIYASPGYLEGHGELDFEDGCSGHHLIIQLDDIQEATQSGWLTDMAPRARVLQTSSHEAAVSAAQRRRLGVPGPLSEGTGNRG